MTMTAGGTATCDSCGGSAGNGGVVDTLVLVGIDFTSGNEVVYHLCRSRTNSPMCCDLALSHITAATTYPHAPPV